VRRIGSKPPHPPSDCRGLLIGFLPKPANKNRLLGQRHRVECARKQAAADYFPERKQPLRSQEPTLWRMVGTLRIPRRHGESPPGRITATSPRRWGALGWRTRGVGREQLFTATRRPTGTARQELNWCAGRGPIVRAVFNRVAPGMLSRREVREMLVMQQSSRHAHAQAKICRRGRGTIPTGPNPAGRVGVDSSATYEGEHNADRHGLVESRSRPGSSSRPGRLAF